MSSAAEGDGPIILFDGVCNLCTGSVRFVIARDARKQFRFASLQSATAGRLLGERDRLESVVLVEGGKAYRKSTAALRIARRLDAAWPLLAALLVIPRPLRDALYDWIGRRRYRWFGKREACWIPHASVAGRFLD
ncbi:MAG: thiol-disulfide oxidoreductase DCC family protein [Burkholderiales bacterium]